MTKCFLNQKKNCREKQFMSFKLHTILSSKMEAALSGPGCESPPLSSTSPPHTPSPVGHLVTPLVVRSAVTELQGLCSSPPYFTELCQNHVAV